MRRAHAAHGRGLDVHVGSGLRLRSAGIGEQASVPWCAGRHCAVALSFLTQIAAALLFEAPTAGGDAAVLRTGIDRGKGRVLNTLSLVDVCLGMGLRRGVY